MSVNLPDPITDADLAVLAEKCRVEQEHRGNLQNARPQIVNALRAYQAAGGDPFELLDSLREWLEDQSEGWS